MNQPHCITCGGNHDGDFCPPKIPLPCAYCSKPDFKGWHQGKCPYCGKLSKVTILDEYHSLETAMAVGEFLENDSPPNNLKAQQ